VSTRSTYVRVFNDLTDHPAWIDLAPEHVGVWVLALGYCSRNRTDGMFPAGAVRRWGGTDEQVGQLVAAGRLHTPGHECEACPEVPAGSLYVHDYLEHQRSREQIEEVSRKRAEAGRAGGKARHGQAPDLQGKQVAKQAASNGEQTSSPATPNTDTDTDTKKDTAAAAADFEQWWTDYPRKEGKAAAAKAYTKAHRQVGAEALANGLQASLTLWRAERRERQYLPHPTTWLNQGRWADEHPTLEATGNQPARPTITANQCDGTECPGVRHEWTDSRNRFLCMGVDA